MSSTPAASSDFLEDARAAEDAWINLELHGPHTDEANSGIDGEIRPTVDATSEATGRAVTLERAREIEKEQIELI
jgi:hypothetical protein